MCFYDLLRLKSVHVLFLVYQSPPGLCLILSGSTARILWFIAPVVRCIMLACPVSLCCAGCSVRFSSIPAVAAICCTLYIPRATLVAPSSPSLGSVFLIPFATHPISFAFTLLVLYCVYVSKPLLLRYSSQKYSAYSYRMPVVW